jgi:hypothetical protein
LRDAPDVIPAKAGIQNRTLLDPRQRHAGMTLARHAGMTLARHAGVTLVRTVPIAMVWDALASDRAAR